MDLRIIILRNLRRQTLENLHAAHQGLTGMRARAKLSVLWPGFNKDLERFLACCMHCRCMGKSQSREPLSPTPCPTYPFESVVADHFDYGGHQYTAIADRFSGWLEVFGGGCGPGNLVQACKNLFTRFGVPTEIYTDGCPAFKSQDFRDFITAWAISQSIIRGLPTVKWTGRTRSEICKKDNCRQHRTPSGSLNTDKVRRSLLQYKNTPLQGVGASPAQLDFGRELRDWTPMTRDKFKVGNTWIQAQHQREIALARKKGFGRGIQ